MNKRKTAMALVVVGCVVGCAALGLLTVRAHAAAPPGHFTDLGDGTVRDNLTGLVWEKALPPSPMSQGAATTYCAGLALSGGGWRLPIATDLQTLVDESVSSPSIDAAYFPSTPAENFWTASPVAGIPAAVWYVDFGVGGAYVGLGSGALRARCVR